MCVRGERESWTRNFLGLSFTICCSSSIVVCQVDYVEIVYRSCSSCRRRRRLMLGPHSFRQHLKLLLLAEPWNEIK